MDCPVGLIHREPTGQSINGEINMIKCLILLPTNYNNGQPVESGKIDSCLSRIGNLIGGYTVDGICHGVFRMADGSYARDTNLTVWACVEEVQVPALRRLAGDFAIELEQESIYFEQTEIAVEFISSK